MCIYIIQCVYIYIYTHIHMYIYIYIVIRIYSNVWLSLVCYGLCISNSLLLCLC